MALPLMFSATFGFVYFVIFIITFAICEFWKIRKNKEQRERWIKKVFSFGNILLIPMAAVLLIYLSGNFLGDKPDGVGFHVVRMWEYMDFYLVFCFSEFIIYAIFLMKKNKRNMLFYITIVELLVIPFIYMGLFNDLCSRGSIPARFILMVLCMEQLLHFEKKKWCFKGLCIVMTIAAMNTGIEMVHQAYDFACGYKEKTYLRDEYGSLEGYAGNPDIRSDNAYNYFTIDYQNSLFSKIAK